MALFPPNQRENKSRMTQDGMAELVSRDQFLRRERGRGKKMFPCSADDAQDWQPYPVDLQYVLPGTGISYVHYSRQEYLENGKTNKNVLISPRLNISDKAALVDFGDRATEQHRSRRTTGVEGGIPLNLLI